MGKPKRKANNTEMTEELMMKIKKAVQEGRTQKQVGEWYGVCDNNVSYAVRSNSMEEFKAFQRRDQNSRNKKEAEPDKETEKKTVIVSYDIARDMAKQLHDVREAQDIQSSALTCIMDTLGEIKNILKKYLEV